MPIHSKHVPVVFILASSLAWVPSMMASPSVAVADGARWASSFRWEASYDLHHADRRGAAGEHAEGAVELTHAWRGRLDLVDRGTRRSSVLHADGRYEEHVIRWEHRYLARWDAGRRLLLRVRSATCRRTDSDASGAREEGPCETPSDFALRCRIEAQPPVGRTWVCHPEGSPPRVPHTATPWYLPRHGGCLRRTGGLPGTGPPEVGACAP